MNSSVWLSTAYLGPVQYYSKLLTDGTVFIEAYESYPKQSYRNRCHILTANGLLPLTIPVKKDSGQKTLTKDIRIDYDTDWQKLHWRAIESAYNASAYFEYMMDDFIPFYEHQEPFLLDFNLKIQEMVLKWFNLVIPIKLTTDFEKSPSGADLREKIHPKPKVQYQDNAFVAKPYHQVYWEGRFDFVPNLSIIDLLFNEGPKGVAFFNEAKFANSLDQTVRS